ncbi:OsmC family protein [Fusibacter ferrireducens]|uniref:OsmC family protein n=1 Tax=Fusibacter ferrireducens TaxID=2785058 RepID=A0ABR9ZSF2_9FIRM|nr:OsmC family protein [Fusibacter ferrireducens]MBF4692881.1 OsmC family protein [Fusibacter ferrireducens]
MDTKEIRLKFSNEFEGKLIAPHGTALVGGEEGMLAPYDMLLGALGSCLYATFLGIAKKKRIGFERIEMHVEGEKREEIPTTLKWVNVKFTIINAEKELGLTQAAKLATEYCSIYQTISQVAEMSYEVIFADAV